MEFSVSERWTIGGTHRSGSSPGAGRGERGSFLIAGAIFLLLFFFVAVLAVDMSNYFYRNMQLQNMADRAALAGGQAFDQRQNAPNVQKIHKRIIDYIRTQQGQEYADLYARDGYQHVEGIDIDARYSSTLGTKTQCTPNFKVNGGTLNFSEPVKMETKFLGSAITDSRGNRYHVTTRLRMTDESGNDSDSEPWGPYDDRDEGNVNTGEYFPPVMVNPEDKETEVEVWGQSWEPDGDHYMEVSTNQDHPENDQTRLLRDGDPLPSVGGGAHDQEDVSYFLQDYVNENGHLDLAENQVIVLFELGIKGDFSTDEKAQQNELADFQDLALLLSVNKPTPANGGGGKGPGLVSPNGSLTKPACAGYYYRIGVTAYDAYKPMFLPKPVFGNEPRTMFSSAVAEVHPKYLESKKPARLKPHGKIPGSLPYIYRDPTSVDVASYYGVEDGSSSGCDISNDFIRCEGLQELIDNLGNDIHLQNQVLYLESGSSSGHWERRGGEWHWVPPTQNSLEVDPSEGNAIHSLTGSGYVFVETSDQAVLIDQDGDEAGVIYGDLDIVALKGTIKFDELTRNMTYKAYFMAPNGRIKQGNNIGNVNIDIIGGLYSHINMGTGNASINVIPDSFCPTDENSKLCKQVSYIEPGTTPYTWDVTLTD